MSTDSSSPLFWTPILYDVAHALASPEDPELRIDEVLGLMRRFVPYDRCALLETASVLARPISIVPEIPVEECDALALRLRDLLDLISGRSLDELHRVTMPQATGRHHLAVPIIGLGETTGLVFIERGELAYEAGHLAFLSIIAAHIGAYLTAVHADRERRASERRFRRLYESGMIGIAFMDARGNVTEANETFASIVGRPRPELQAGGVNWHEMTPPGHLDRDQAAIREAIERGACGPYEKRFVREDGCPITVLAGAAQLEDEDSLVSFVLDVTEHRRIEIERASLLEARERDVELLQMFVAMLGHDLRNPLSAIQVSAERLKRGKPEQYEKLIDRILSSTGRMEHMVAQLFDLTRIRLAGGVPLEPERVDLADVCRRAIEELQAVHADASIRLEVQGNVTGEWDCDRVIQVVSNLVANAIEHAAGIPEVLVRATGAEQAVTLHLHNAGAIPQDLLPVLFHPFRGTQVAGRRKGLGLGLFITKHIVEAHGGAMEVQSAGATGTTFVVRLPRKAIPRAARDALREARISFLAGAPGPRRRV